MNTPSYKKGSDQEVSRYFTAHEFDCPCANCERTPIDDTLLKQLDAMRDALACPIFIDSGYRCDRHQYELAKAGYETAKGISTHQVGKAADIRTGKHTGLELEAAAREAGFTSVGVGKTWAHVDVRAGERRWTYQR